jgi:hypothetical protein
VRCGAAEDLVPIEGQPRARKLTAQQSHDPGIGVSRGVGVDLLNRDHFGSEHHRLQIEPAAVVQHSRHPLKEAPVDLLLATGTVVSRRAEVLKRPEARDRIKPAKGLARHPTRVANVDVEAVATASCCLSRGQRYAQPARADVTNVVQQPAPTTAEIKHPSPRPNPDLLGHVLVFAALRLLKAQREVAVVFGSAEVRQLAQAESNDPISQRIGEVQVLTVGHGSARPLRRRRDSGQPAATHPDLEHTRERTYDGRARPRRRVRSSRRAPSKATSAGMQDMSLSLRRSPCGLGHDVPALPAGSG